MQGPQKRTSLPSPACTRVASGKQPACAPHNQTSLLHAPHLGLLSGWVGCKHSGWTEGVLAALVQGHVVSVMLGG